jgi:hypothetical protein
MECSADVASVCAYRDEQEADMSAFLTLIPSSSQRRKREYF